MSCIRLYSLKTYRETFLESAKLTPIPPPFVHRTVPICHANIFCSSLYSALEKSFAPFTSADSIMLTSCRVTTNSTHFLQCDSTPNCFHLLCNRGCTYTRFVTSGSRRRCSASTRSSS